MADLYRSAAAPGPSHGVDVAARTARIRGGNTGGSEHRAGGASCHRPARRLPYEPLGEGAGRQGAMAGVAPARSHGGRLGVGLTSRAFYATRLATHRVVTGSPCG